MSGLVQDRALTEVIRSAAKAGEPDRYLSALLAPREARDDLVTLAAFLAEMAKIAEQVSDPMLGEIRIQWWRDALLPSQEGTLSGNPIADAFADVMKRRALSQSALSDLLDAHTHALYPSSPPSVEALFLELDFTETAAFHFAGQILGATEDPAFAGMTHDAGIAYGLARRALRMPFSLARGREILPGDWQLNSAAVTDASAGPGALSLGIKHLVQEARARLVQIKANWPRTSPELKAALLPVALVEPYLKALERRGYDAAHEIGDVSPLTRVWRLGRAHVRGRL